MIHKKKSHLQKLTDQYLRIYSGFGTVYCPALKKTVAFREYGWRHILKHKHTSREIEERLKLLPLAPKLLSLTTTVQVRRYHNDRFHYEFQALMDGIILSVLVYEEAGQYYFKSIFKV